MAAYPTLPIDARESKRTPRDGREEDPAGDGAVRVRKLYADKFDFDIKHPYLTSAQMTTLQSFYNSNATASTIDLTWPEDSVVYTVRFGKGALRTQYVSASRRHAWVRLVGV
jgi:hypothetical protein